MYLRHLCFFFKQKTAYEMRISDWSSDVCSSDLHHAHQENTPRPPAWHTRQTCLQCTLHADRNLQGKDVKHRQGEEGEQHGEGAQHPGRLQPDRKRVV